MARSPLCLSREARAGPWLCRRPRLPLGSRLRNDLACSMMSSSALVSMLPAASVSADSRTPSTRSPRIPVPGTSRVLDPPSGNGASSRQGATTLTGRGYHCGRKTGIWARPSWPFVPRQIAWPSGDTRPPPRAFRQQVGGEAARVVSDRAQVDERQSSSKGSGPPALRTWVRWSARSRSRRRRSWSPKGGGWYSEARGVDRPQAGERLEERVGHR